MLNSMAKGVGWDVCMYILLVRQPPKSGHDDAGSAARDFYSILELFDAYIGTRDYPS